MPGQALTRLTPGTGRRPRSSIAHDRRPFATARADDASPRSMRPVQSTRLAWPSVLARCPAGLTSRQGARRGGGAAAPPYQAREHGAGARRVGSVVAGTACSPAPTSLAGPTSGFACVLADRHWEKGTRSRCLMTAPTDSPQRGARSVPLFGGGQKGFQELPLGVGEVGFVGGVFHRLNTAAAKVSRTSARPRSSHCRHFTPLSSLRSPPNRNLIPNNLIFQIGSNQ
jgi:hypothetical protein